MIHRKRRSGIALIYGIFALTCVCAVTSLAVDLGRFHVAKTELYTAADAAARYAATGIANGTAPRKAIAVASANHVDGVPLILQAGDVTIGTWDADSKTFTAGGFSPNAVRVTAHRAESRGTAIPTMFARLFGRQSVDLQAVSIALFTAGTTTELTAPSSGNPWLAGMPDGTLANGYDSAPANSPAQVSSIQIVPGAQLNFSFTGSASYMPETQPFDPDGNPGWVLYNYAGRENGMSQLNAPLTSVVGVFLDDTQPNLAGSPPADLDFTSVDSRDFAILSPQLRQPFFIGNGVRNDGATRQQFVVPTGATRFYLGIMDGQQWSDNAGELTSTVVQRDSMTLVK